MQPDSDEFHSQQNGLATPLTSIGASQNGVSMLVWVEE